MGARERKWEARVGELIVYPAHGVGRLEAVRKQEIAGKTLDLLVVRMLEDDSRILVPRENAGRVGLRGVMKRDDAARIWEILGTRVRKRRGGVTWSRQFREYQDKLKSGSVFEIAEVLRDLIRLQREKELSFGERRVLDSARSLLVQELAAAQNQQADSVEAQIKELVR
jgi:CarD family transcriptional regulator